MACNRDFKDAKSVKMEKLGNIKCMCMYGACVHTRSWYKFVVSLHFTPYRYHYIGVVVVFLHDIGDVFLLSGKTLLCFSELNGKKYKAVNMLANTLFGGFVIQWYKLAAHTETCNFVNAQCYNATTP